MYQWPTHEEEWDYKSDAKCQTSNPRRNSDQILPRLVTSFFFRFFWISVLSFRLFGMYVMKHANRVYSSTPSSVANSDCRSLHINRGISSSGLNVLHNVRRRPSVMILTVRTRRRSAPETARALPDASAAIAVFTSFNIEGILFFTNVREAREKNRAIVFPSDRWKPCLLNEQIRCWSEK